MSATKNNQKENRGNIVTSLIFLLYCNFIIYDVVSCFAEMISILFGCQHDHIPFNLKGNFYIYLYVSLSVRVRNHEYI